MGDKRTWVVAALVATLIAAGVAVVTGGVGMVSAATRSGCEVGYTVTSQWQHGFSADLQLRNTGGAALTSWTLTWTFPGTQRVTAGWNGRYSQSGSRVTVHAMPWNSRIAAGGLVRLGFNGSHPGSDPRPAAFAVNGHTCTITTLPTTTPTTATPTTATPTTPTTTAASPSTTGTSGPTLGAGRIQFGPVYTGDATSYRATGVGNCSYEATPDRMIAAMNQTDYQNSQACGAHVAVTGPNGATVTVRIVDRCPECRPGDLDLSAEAFAKLAAPSAGRIRISWTLLSPTPSGPIAYTYKGGSTQHWCAIQVRNHRNPVRSLEVQVGGAWKSLPRQDYNYFLSSDGTGCGRPLRATDIYGHQLTDTGIAFRPGVVQQGKGQFGAPAGS